MNKVHMKQESKRFKQWIALGKKGKIPSKAWCCQHLKMCRVYLQFYVCLVFSFSVWFGPVGCAGMCLVFMHICVYIYICAYRLPMLWTNLQALFFPHAFNPLRCPFRRSFLDQTGSMCTAYSSMGNLEKGEDQNARLLVIYMMYHFKKKTPILVHENVIGFIATEMSDQATSYGYDTFTIRVKPMDVGFHVGRPRRRVNCPILYGFWNNLCLCDVYGCIWLYCNA